MSFRKELEGLINRFSKENGSDTPDLILAGYLDDCLKAFDNAVKAREKWYGRDKAVANNKTASSEVPSTSHAYGRSVTYREDISEEPVTYREDISEEPVTYREDQ